jgi:hypothetical protein
VKNHPTIDPGRVATYEAEGWRAYYDRRWLAAFRWLIGLNREGFGMNLPAAVAAAMDTVCASIAFAPLEGNDPDKTRLHLTRFYERAAPVLASSTAAGDLAVLELAYWIVHRELAIERRSHPEIVVADALDDIEPMVESLARLHAALFDSDPQTMRASAEYRALAAKTVDRITGGYSTDIPGDWNRIQAYLRQAYGEIAVVQRRQEVASI